MEKPLWQINTNFCDITDMFNKYRSRSPKVVCKNGVIYSFAKFTRKHRCRSLLFKKKKILADYKETRTQVLSCELWKVFKNILFEELLQVAVNNDSESYNNNPLKKCWNFKAVFQRNSVGIPDVNIWNYSEILMTFHWNTIKLTF